MFCSSGEALINNAILLVGSNFKILLSCDLISKMAVVEIGVVCAYLHCKIYTCR